MSAWSASLRIARREAGKAKGRAGLVLAMIALPVAVLTFAAISYDMFTLSPQEMALRRLGHADALLIWNPDHSAIQQAPGESWTGAGPLPLRQGNSSVSQSEIISLLPRDSRIIPYGELNLRVNAGGAVIHLPSRTLDIGDPMMRGLAEVVQGRPPAGGDEVALSVPAARKLGLRPGDTLRRLAPDQELRVVGLVEFPSELKPLAVFAGQSPLAPPEQRFQWFVDSPAPLTEHEVEALHTIGITAVTRQAYDNTPRLAMPGESAEGLAIGLLASGLVALEVILLAGPAFAVGARRRARDLALIAAAGGEPKHLRRVVLADGVVLGAGGGVLGLACGICVAIAARPWVEEYLAHARAGGWRFFPAALAGLACLAVGTGLVAAAVPAFIAARQDVVQVLNGRRGLLRSRRRWIALGLTMVLLGTVVGVRGARSVRESLILLGIVLAELGLVLLTPATVGLIAKAGRWMPLSMRLALRDTARNRTAAAPAISAIMAAVAGAVAVGVMVAGSAQQQQARYVAALPLGHFDVYSASDADSTSPDWAQVEAAVRSVLPAAQMVTYAAPCCPEQRHGAHCEIAVIVPPEKRCSFMLSQYQLSEAQLSAALSDERCLRRPPDERYGLVWSAGSIVDDGAALGLLTGADKADIEAARRTLAAGGVVVTDPLLIARDEAIVTKIAEQDKPEDLGIALKVPAHYLSTAQTRSQTIVSSGLAARLGIQKATRSAVGSAGVVPTEDQAALLQEALGADLYLMVERGPTAPGDPSVLLLALVAAAIALGAVGIATGLATVDSRGDLATLAAIGAAPQIRRRMSLSRAAIISGLGTLLGTLAGLGGAGVILVALNRVYESRWPPGEPIPFTVPWQSLAIIVLVPMVAMAGAALFTRAGLPSERRL